MTNKDINVIVEEQNQEDNNCLSNENDSSDDDTRTEIQFDSQKLNKANKAANVYHAAEEQNKKQLEK